MILYMSTNRFLLTHERFDLRFQNISLSVRAEDRAKRFLHYSPTPLEFLVTLHIEEHFNTKYRTCVL